MSNPQEQLSQSSQRDKIEQSNAQQNQLEQKQISIIPDTQQIKQGDQEKNQQLKSQEKKTTGFSLKLKQKAAPDEVQVQAVVTSIDQQKQQQVQQQNELLQNDLNQQMREIENELFTGLKTIVKVTLSFVSVMIVLQTALMIAAIIARAQGTQCVK